MKKIVYIEGIKGLAAITVVISHYLQFYYIDDFFINPSTQAHYLLSKTPINLFYNGNASVCFFFIISSYLISTKLYSNNYNKISFSKPVIQRYFNLMIPTFISLIFCYILLNFNLYTAFTEYTKDFRYNDMSKNFIYFIKIAIFDVFFKYSNSYNTVLWVMTYNVYGTLLVYTFFTLFSNIKRRYIIYFIGIIVFANSYYLAFVLGILLADINYNKSKIMCIFTKKLTLNYIFLIVGLILSSFPYNDVSKTLYEILILDIENFNFFVFYHILGSFVVLYAITNTTKLQKIFSNKILVYLGKNSFSLFLLHFPILASFSFYIFAYFNKYYSYTNSFLISFIISIIFTFVASHFFTKHVIDCSSLWSEKIYDKYF
ncbi:acyltransferase family protein [Acetoanaerobium noterae]|uniref:acyltransferase family protein n=1 Tax=Acetoanaerobium noterae TaxID=745369 RepID=UPI003342AEAB